MPLPKAFLDVSIGGTAAGRITVQLRTDVAPKTCANFMALCTGEKGMGRCGRHLAYKGSVFHRIIPGFMAQGGDFQHFNGTGGESIYGPTFPDETFALRHSEAGTLAMANAGKDTNASQFYFTLNATTWLDSKHVVFGTVVAGMDVLKKVEAVGSKSGTPSKRVAIENCGIIDDDAVRKAHADEATAKAVAQAEEQVAAQAARETRLPWVEDADAASARRLREMMQSRQQQKGSAAAGSAAAAAAGDGGAAGGPAREQGRPHPGGGAAADDEEEAPEALRQGDAVQAMDPRQRKLFELRLKLNESRKANQSAMVAEKKRKDNPDGLRQEAKRRATEGSAAASAEQLKAHGITDGSKYYLLQSLDEAEQKYAKQDAKKRGGGFGWDGFNQKASFNTYMKQTELMGPVDVEAYEAAKARDPSLAAADPESIAYGTQGTNVGPEALDRLVADMAAREKAQQKFSRRRTAYADRDADGINERNSHFNRKLERTYGTYTAEIKAALERGTALP